MEHPDLSAWIAHIDAVARAHLRARDRTGAGLAAAVRALSARYNRRGEAGSGQPRSGQPLPQGPTEPGEMAARLRFFLVRDLLKMAGPLGELALGGALPRSRRWRVLDLGAGLGASTFGVERFARLSGHADSLEVVALDRDSGGLGLMRALATPRAGMDLLPLALATETGDLRGPLPEGPFDLVLMGLCLNELCTAGTEAGAAAELLARAAERLDAHGSLLIIEPALRSASRFVHAVRAELLEAGDLRLFAPCLHSGACPMLARARDWCHEDLPVALPAELRPVAEAAGLRYERLTFSYLTLRKGGPTLREAAPRRGDPYRIVGGTRRTKGKIELRACGGSDRSPGGPVIMRLDRYRAAGNAALDDARRGSLLTIEGGEPKGERLRVAEHTKVRPWPTSR